MNILMITSSPHPKDASSSTLLAEHFARGAQEAGHTVTFFDAGHANLHPCLGCGHCGTAGPCVHKDDMAQARAAILSSDMLVFVTPLYYFGMTAQLKTLVDRFYAFNEELMGKKLKTALLTAAWDNEDWIMQALVSHYQTICRYLNFQDMGMILGLGCGTPAMTAASGFPEKAYEFGRKL
jgi:multimeric flavodoxin WrbA